MHFVKSVKKNNVKSNNKQTIQMFFFSFYFSSEFGIVIVWLRSNEYNVMF